jgi:hypothetical protein
LGLCLECGRPVLALTGGQAPRQSLSLSKPVVVVIGQNGADFNVAAAAGRALRCALMKFIRKMNE